MLFNWLISLTHPVKRITHFEVDSKNIKVLIHACPASLLGWISSAFVKNNETHIRANQELFILEEWDFFGRTKTYIPVKNVTSIKLREQFRTGLVVLAIVCFSFSIYFIRLGYSTAALENIKIVLFSVGMLALMLAIFLKKRVLVSIHRGTLVNYLKFRASSEEFEKLREGMEMIMLLSTGGVTAIKTRNQRKKLNEKKANEKKKIMEKKANERKLNNKKNIKEKVVVD